MNLCSLGTGSGGNAVLLECGDTRVLVDAGFPARELKLRLARIGVAPESIQALVVTHEHHDHARGAARAASRWGWEVHATPGTLGALALGDGVRTVAAGASIAVGNLSIRTVPLPHDAREPVGVVATSRRTGDRVAVLYDAGHVTGAMREALARVDVLVIEANHDEGMLRAGPYPPSVRARIAGPHGHLGNRAAAGLAAECVWKGLRRVVLAHLSERCNMPELAVRAARDALRRTAFRGEVCVAPQASPVEVGALRRDDVQLAFAW